MLVCLFGPALITQHPIAEYLIFTAGKNDPVWLGEVVKVYVSKLFFRYIKINRYADTHTTTAGKDVS